MADSEMESDSSSVDGVFPARQNQEALSKRIESLEQENRVLRMEIETLKLKNKTLQEENKELKQHGVNIQARAEQEEEYISNTLMKKINSLKKEKETLAMNYEHEEEYLTNDLSRKLFQLRNEKVELEQTLEKEQEAQVNKLLQRINRLENETNQKQQVLEQLRREKVELENSLEQEQESLVNRLWKRMDKLEVEKRKLQERLEQPVSAPPSPRCKETDVNTMTQNIITLKNEVTRYRNMLNATKHENQEKMAALLKEEKEIKAENLRLQRKLQLEMERREQLCRHLSESESSLEMDDERHFNEMTKSQDSNPKDGSRSRTVSSPIPYQAATPAKPISPNMSGTVSPQHPYRCSSCGQVCASNPGGFHHSSTPAPSALSSSLPGTSPTSSFLYHGVPTNATPTSQQRPTHRPPSGAGDKFIKPAPPKS